MCKRLQLSTDSIHSRLIQSTDYGHPERAFFQKFEIFGLGQTNWAENLWGIWAISGQTISTILALWVPYPWESVAGPLSYKKLWFLGLKHITPKYSQNKIWAVQNLENSVRTSVFGGYWYWFLGLKHTSPKYSQNKIWAVKNLEKSLRTSVFGDWYDHDSWTL